MLHLALVQNLLTAVGAGPHLARPNFPVPPRAFPARIQIALLPFSEEALRHFAFLERPEGEPIDDAEEFAAFARAAAAARRRRRRNRPDRRRLRDDLAPVPLNRGWAGRACRADGRGQAVHRPARAQATGEHFRFAELVAVTDLASAKAAIETIVEQGEGARGEWKTRTLAGC